MKPERNFLPYDINVFRRNLNRYMASQRANHKTSQKEIATAVGVSECALCDWKDGRSFPRISKLQALACYFGIEISDLIEDKSMIRDRIPMEQQVVLDLYNKISDEEKSMIMRMLQFFADEKLSEGEVAVLATYNELTDDKKELAIRMLHTLK